MLRPTTSVGLMSRRKIARTIIASSAPMAMLVRMLFIRTVM